MANEIVIAAIGGQRAIEKVRRVAVIMDGLGMRGGEELPSALCGTAGPDWLGSPGAHPAARRATASAETSPKPLPARRIRFISIYSL